MTFLELQAASAVNRASKADQPPFSAVTFRMATLPNPRSPLVPASQHLLQHPLPTSMTPPTTPPTTLSNPHSSYKAATCIATCSESKPEAIPSVEPPPSPTNLTPVPQTMTSSTPKRESREDFDAIILYDRLVSDA